MNGSHPSAALTPPPSPGDRAGRVASLRPLIAPSSVAIVGASADPDRIGGRPIAFMQRHGFRGTILPVNPNRADIQGLPAFASVADLPQAPDVAVVAVAGDAAIEAIDGLGRLGTRSAIVFSSGFAETGPEGIARQSRLLRAARSHGMRVLGPNCAGMFNARIGFYPIFASVFARPSPAAARIGMVGQSGAFCTHLYTLAGRRGLGMATCLTTGNEMDIDVAAGIEWFVDDPEVDVIAAYSEGFKDGARLIDALEAARRARKPVVMMKVGRSALGAEAIRSHTAAIAGDDAVADAVLAELGVARARSIEHMLDTVYAATRRIYPVRNTLGVISISGGVGVLAADAAAAEGVEMPGMPDALQDRLRELVPFASARNPVDCTAQAINEPSLVGRFAEAMADEGGYAAILAFLSTGGGPKLARAIRESLSAVQSNHPDRLFVVSQIADDDEAAEYARRGFLSFEDPTRAVTAIAALGRFGQAFARAPAAPARQGPPIALPTGPSNEADAQQLLAGHGIDFAPSRVCASADDAVHAAREIGFPVVLKILSAQIMHKSDVGGVRLGLADEAAVREAFDAVMSSVRRAEPGARLDGVLVARQLGGGVECVMGTTCDPVFGPVAMFGLGGVFVETLRDVVIARCPFDEAAARAMVLAIRGAPLLTGARGRPPADVGALARMLSRLSAFAAGAGSALGSVELNPVIALPDGQGAWAVDAVVSPAPVAPPTDPA